MQYCYHRMNTNFKSMMAVSSSFICEQQQSRLVGHPSLLQTAASSSELLGGPAESILMIVPSEKEACSALMRVDVVLVVHFYLYVYLSKI